MAVNVNDKIRKLSPARRRKVEARASELVAEEMTLRELRTARKLTQVRLARTLGITQDSVSRWRSEATSCCPRSARPSKPWEATCRWSPSSPTAPRSCWPGSRRTTYRHRRENASLLIAER